MASHFANLLANNDPPSEQAMREINRSMAAPLQALAEMDQKIVQLEAQLKILRDERNDIQTSVKDYRTIMSPIRRLPNDVLHEIFCHCLPSRRNPALSSADAPLLLSRICSKWRSIVFSSPRLWAQLHIPFCDEDRNWDPPAPPTSDAGIMEKERKQRAIRALNQRLQVVKEWLSRSRNCPLSISLSYTSSLDLAPEESSVRNPGADDATTKLFEILVSHIHHLKSLELMMPLEIYRQLDSMISLDSLSTLTELRTNFYDQIPLADRDGSESVKLFTAPHLRRLSLDGYPTARLWPLNTFPFADHGKRLTYFSTHVVFSLGECFALLKHCENLVHCRIHMISYLDTNVTPMQGTASLPKLLSLAIIDDTNNDEGTSLFYSSIDAPRLQFLDFVVQNAPYNAHSGTQAHPVHSIVNLLRKSTELKKLVIDPFTFTSSHLRQMLQAVNPGLEQLVFGQEGAFRSSKVNRPYIDLDSISWDIGSIFLEEDVGTHPDILLPSLKILESSIGSMSDDTLLKLITRRIDLASRGRCVSLQLVRNISIKPKRMDIEKEVASHRERIAAESGHPVGPIKMYLEYDAYDEGLTSDPLSSSFGITNDRLWPYDELDEFDGVKIAT